MDFVKIAMWSGPRNISTALMRSFENRDDTFVTDEPLYGYYLKQTKIDHPMKNEIINSSDTNWKSISKFLTGDIPKNKSIWYQKHMAQHNIFISDMSWICELNNCFLIRNPKDVIKSYIKKLQLNSSHQLGFLQQFNLFNFLEEKGCDIIIIDSIDLLINPQNILKLLCNRLNIPFTNKMLNWPKGIRSSDGIWGKHWYNNVINTTGFKSYIDNNQKLPKKYHNIYHECIDYYQYLYEKRIH